VWRGWKRKSLDNRELRKKAVTNYELPNNKPSWCVYPDLFGTIELAGLGLGNYGWQS
jgi:hypothetical protein